MSRLERWIWTAVYFAAGAALLAGAAALFATPRFHEIGNIGAYTVALFWIGAWKRYRAGIVRDLGWGARTAIIALRQRLNPLMIHLLRRSIRRGEVDGLTAYVVAASHAEFEQRMTRLRDAIDEIRIVFPARYARLKRLAPALYVDGMSGAAGFFYGTNVIGVHPGLLDEWRPESVAMALCHELSHMYIASRGVRLTPFAETRLELIAIDEMNLWGRRLWRSGRATNQSWAEFGQMQRGNRERWWWRNDGSRFHGSELETPSRSAEPIPPEARP